MTELAMLAEEIRVNERTLRRAINEGTLRAARPTPRKLSLPLSERQYVRRSWGLLSALRSALRTEHNVRFALLFGSAARGTDTAQSDVDMLVALRDPSLDRVVDLEEKLCNVIGRRVELIRLDDAETEPGFFVEAIAEGRVLVDREGRWPRLKRQAGAIRRRAEAEGLPRVESALAKIDRLAA